MYASVFEEGHDYNEIYVNGDADLFEEHFKDYPIVPGAFSLHLCISHIVDCVKKELGEAFIFKRIRKVRFIKPILPHTNIKIEMKKYTQINSEVIANFELSDNNATVLVDGCIALGEKYE